MWNFFRLENEHLNNCGEFRAVRDISVAPLNADDQTLLEQMMDQDDGVRNRQKNRLWKTSQSISLRRPRLASQYVWLPLLSDEFPSGFKHWIIFKLISYQGESNEIDGIQSFFT